MFAKTPDGRAKPFYIWIIEIFGTLVFWTVLLEIIRPLLPRSILETNARLVTFIFFPLIFYIVHKASWEVQKKWRKKHPLTPEQIAELEEKTKELDYARESQTIDLGAEFRRFITWFKQKYKGD